MKALISFMALLLCFTVNAQQKITVFAAASLTNVMQDIGKRYQEQYSDTEIIFSFASSSALARQIKQGAPADIFISADQTWMDYLITNGLVTQKETLLSNSLVLIAPMNSALSNLIINKQTDWHALLPKGERLAIGDPAHVPAGMYAKEALTKLGVYDTLEPQFAPTGNVRAALMLVELGEAKLGIVYSTDAKASHKVKILARFPADSFSAIQYPMTIINHNVATQHFYDFLKTDIAIAIFKQHGFVTQ